MAKSYFELIKETLDQRAIIDNRNVVALSAVSPSVLIAFNQACEFMRDLHHWRWNHRTEQYVADIGQNAFPMPYGIVLRLFANELTKKEKCELKYVKDLTKTEGCPSEWTNDWEKEEIKIAPAVSSNCGEISVIEVEYEDKHIACLGNRTDGNLLKRFDTAEDTKNQFLNIPDYIYDAYARCVILKTRIYLNENAQSTVFPAQDKEWKEALGGLMAFAKTPLYSERTEL